MIIMPKEMKVKQICSDMGEIMNREVVFFDGRDKDCLWEGLEIFL